MSKRKRDREPHQVNDQAADVRPFKKQAAVESLLPIDSGSHQQSIYLQIITGSYDRILHGIIATLPALGSASSKVQFKDNFLFNAHASAIKCLALSPSSPEDNIDGGKVMLATGGTDERINLYSVSTSLPLGPSLPTLSSVPSLENPKNKELGVLFHHTSTVNVVHFPTKSKLISGSDDNTIAISRTRDWTVLSTVKAPMPKIQGRPSGDTAPLGGAPSGITDFAVHPSMKLMISVGKGEKCMRLWNLVTGKKANVLNFERDFLKSVGEGKWSKGEGQRVVWNSAGDEFAIAFEKGVAVFGMDSETKCIAIPQPSSKVHQITYISAASGSSDLLAISTENGRILFYSTDVQASPSDGVATTDKIPNALAIAYLGGKEAGVKGRIKAFHIISPLAQVKTDTRILVTAGSDGAVMIWEITGEDLLTSPKPTNVNTNGTASNGIPDIKHIGALLGKYDTGNRITCMKALQLHGLSAPEDDESGEQSLGDSDDESSEDETAADLKDDFEGFQ